ncbi:putative nucleocapsid protein [Fusarium culmorum virus 1]|uniref:Putative nucleocapsid protein n=1 Tax=Fusarium culmorum virus 1 TaxID=2711135 RepID=A0A6C0WZ46_9VIRU|nr:putative nucleocapsid protein [Fusarium culmorum virus 1]
MSAGKSTDVPAEVSTASPPGASDQSTARNAPETQQRDHARRGGMVGSPARSYEPKQNDCLTSSELASGQAGNHSDSVLKILQQWLGAKGVATSPQSVGELFPDGWAVGRTAIPIKMRNGEPYWLSRVLPHLRGYDKEGDEVKYIELGRDALNVVRLTAQWLSPVDIVASILSDVKNAVVSKEDVLAVAQRSPQALEKLKESGKQFKEHFNRFLDPVALRRDPRFNQVAQEYKARLRALIDEQQKCILAARRATAAVNACLGERDAALSRLDPGYQAKRATAADALAQYGIDLGADQEMAAMEETAADVLGSLDF